MDPSQRGGRNVATHWFFLGFYYIILFLFSGKTMKTFVLFLDDCLFCASVRWESWYRPSYLRVHRFLAALIGTQKKGKEGVALVGMKLRVGKKKGKEKTFYSYRIVVLKKKKRMWQGRYRKGEEKSSPPKKKTSYFSSSFFFGLLNTFNYICILGNWRRKFIHVCECLESRHALHWCRNNNLEYACWYTFFSIHFFPICFSGLLSLS